MLYVIVILVFLFLCYHLGKEKGKVKELFEVEKEFREMKASVESSEKMLKDFKKMADKFAQEYEITITEDVKEK